MWRTRAKSRMSVKTRTRVEIWTRTRMVTKTKTRWRLSLRIEMFHLVADNLWTPWQRFGVHLQNTSATWEFESKVAQWANIFEEPCCNFTRSDSPPLKFRFKSLIWPFCGWTADRLYCLYCTQLFDSHTPGTSWWWRWSRWWLWSRWRLWRWWLWPTREASWMKMKMILMTVFTNDEGTWVWAELFLLWSY